MKLDPAISITNARRIVDLRNLVIHNYDSVDNVIIWGIISKDLPLLRDEVKMLFENEGNLTTESTD